MLYVDVCVWVSVCITLPVWHLRPAAARYRVWPISGAELAVVGVVLKGPDYGSLPAVFFHCFTFLAHNLCFFACVFLSLALGRGFCVCLGNTECED